MDHRAQGVRGVTSQSSKCHPPPSPPFFLIKKGRKNGTFLWEILPPWKSDSGPHRIFSERKGGKKIFFARINKITDYFRFGPRGGAKKIYQETNCEISQKKTRKNHFKTWKASFITWKASFITWKPSFITWKPSLKYKQKTAFRLFNHF